MVRWPYLSRDDTVLTRAIHPRSTTLLAWKSTHLHHFRLLLLWSNFAALKVKLYLYGPTSSSFVDHLTTSKIDEYFAPTIATIMYFEVLWENLSSAYLLAYLTFFQILWKSRCNILVTFPSHLKKLRFILRSWLEKLNCGFFHSFPLNEDTWERISKSWLQECTFLVIESQFDMFHDLKWVFKFTVSGSTLVVTPLLQKTSALSTNSPSKCQQKKLSFYFFNFEWPKQPYHYKKQWDLSWNRTSEQGQIGHIQFYVDEWYLKSSRSWGASTILR